MRYMILLKARQPATPPPPELFEAITQLGNEATAAGALLDTAGLAPSAAGALVQLREGSISVSDGPFAEAMETVGYALYDVGSTEEAVEWASRFLAVHRDLWPEWSGDAEVLQVFGPS